MDLTSALLLGSVYLNVYLTYRLKFKKKTDFATLEMEKEEIGIIKDRITRLKQEMESLPEEDLM